jgi:hypothetical protein
MRTDVINNNNMTAHVLGFSVLLLITTFCFAIFTLVYNQIEGSSQWNELKKISGAHNAMTTAYTECRNKVFEEASPSECQLFVLNYGKARGFENAQAVFDDIVSLSNQLASEHSNER